MVKSNPKNKASSTSSGNEVSPQSFWAQGLCLPYGFLVLTTPIFYTSLIKFSIDSAQRPAFVSAALGELLVENSSTAFINVTSFSLTYQNPKVNNCEGEANPGGH